MDLIPDGVGVRIRDGVVNAVDEPLSNRSGVLGDLVRSRSGRRSRTNISHSSVLCRAVEVRSFDNSFLAAVVDGRRPCAHPLDVGMMSREVKY